MSPIGGLPTELAHLSWLVGRWGGIGEAVYPTAAPYRYEQVVEFASDGRAFLEYRSISWVVDEQNNRIARSATESGYWRPLPDNEVEVLLAHPAGRVEVWLGRVEVTAIEDARVTGARLELTTDAVVRTQSGDDVRAGQRLYGLVGGKLLTTYDMAADGHPLANHLAIALEPIQAEQE
jgi:THAP4-like, heme-binding beta-barrel domain